METTAEDDSSVCIVCKKPWARWSCQRKGCDHSYHLHCVKKHQPDEFITVGGGWRCIDCVKEKIQLGASFECDEIESIWDTRNGESETKYLVKYKNLAHVHNCWIPESKIRQKAPEHLAKFNQEYQKDNKGTTWKKEWTRPERLLMQRNLMYEDVALKFFQGLESQLEYCNNEWLVKWKGLGYEHVTWELGSLNFLHSNEAKRLKQEYCHRQVDAARRAKLVAEHNTIKQDPFVRLDTFPSGFPHDLDNGYLDSLNRLRQFWHKSQNAVFIDQEERVIKIILFIKSIIYHIDQPFLILSTMKSLSLWKDKIRLLIPSVHTVVHTNRSLSSLVEITEFWGQDGHLLFQVLLSNPDSIQGFEAIKHISWEGLIVDQCDNVDMLMHLEQIEALSTNFKLLILNNQLKDDPSHYVKLLSFLEPGDDYSDPDISILKEKFSRCIAYQSETDSSSCDTVPLTGEKRGALWEGLDNRYFCQNLSPLLNPRKRKERPNDVLDLCVSHAVMIKKKRNLEKPTNTFISESSCEERDTLSMQLANLSVSSIETDVSANTDASVGKIKRLIINGQRSKQIVLLKDGIRTIQFLLKPRLLRLCEMSGIPENVNSVAYLFFNHVLKSHKAMLAPFIITRSCLRGLLEVDPRCKSSPLNEQCEQFLRWLEIAKTIVSPHSVPRLTYYDPPNTISPNAQVVPQETQLLEHKIERICARRENRLRARQKSELLDLKNYEESERCCHWRAHESVIKHMHTITAANKNSNMLEVKTVLKFKAFQEHMLGQRSRLKCLQEKAMDLEKLRKEEWVKMVKSGELEESFDFSRIPLPDSEFVLEKFDWLCAERATNCGVSSSKKNVLEKIDCIPPTIGEPSSVVAGPLTDMENLPYCDDILLEHEERQTNTDFNDAHASMPDIGVSTLGRPDILSESSNDFEIPSFTQEMFPNGLNQDPFVNELTRINHMRGDLTKKLEEKKSRLKSQWEGEVQNIKRKYDELNKEQGATFRNHKKFLEGLTGKVEGGQTVNRELRAFEMAAESDMLLQDWNQLFSIQNSPTPSAPVSEPAFVNCASFWRSTCMPLLQNTQAPPVETSQAPPTIANQAPSVQTNVAPPFTASRVPAVPSGLVSSSTPISTSPVFHMLTNEALTTSASIGPNCVSTCQVPRIWSHQASTIPANPASACSSTVHGADVPANLGPQISHIWNLPTQGTLNLPVLNSQHLLNPDILGMSPSNIWASSFQKTRASVVATAQVSSVQVPHGQADLGAPLWTNAARPTLRRLVPQVIAMSHPLSSTGTPTLSLMPTHIQSIRSPYVHTASLVARPSGSHRAISSQRVLQAPSPHIRHLRPHMSLTRPQPPRSDPRNVPNFGGSI